jgi:hypothetical protein
MTMPKFSGAPVKFTKKSANDKYPSVTLARLTDTFGSVSTDRHGNLTLLLSSKSDTNSTFKVTFRQNRSSTFIATEWPKGLRKPSVGRAIEYVVKGLV